MFNIVKSKKTLYNSNFQSGYIGDITYTYNVIRLRQTNL